MKFVRKVSEESVRISSGKRLIERAVEAYMKGLACVQMEWYEVVEWVKRMI